MDGEQMVDFVAALDPANAADVAPGVLVATAG